MAFPDLIREAALRVPLKEPRVVLRCLLHRWITQRTSLGVIPRRLPWIRRIAHRLCSAEQPCGHRAEVHHHWMAFGGMDEVFHHGIDQRKVPRGLSIGWRFKLCNSKPRIRQPRHVANIVGAQAVQRIECAIVQLRATPQLWIHHHLQRGCRSRDCVYRVPVHAYLRNARLRKGRRCIKQRRRHPARTLLSHPSHSCCYLARDQTGNAGTWIPCSSYTARLAIAAAIAEP